MRSGRDLKGSSYVCLRKMLSPKAKNISTTVYYVVDVLHNFRILILHSC